MKHRTRVLITTLIFTLGIVALLTVLDNIPDDNACKEYSFNDKVYITEGFYKGQTGVVTSVEWLKFPNCNRSYVILLDTPSVTARVKVDEMHLQNNK